MAEKQIETCPPQDTGSFGDYPDPLSWFVATFGSEPEDMDQTIKAALEMGIPWPHDGVIWLTPDPE